MGRYYENLYDLSEYFCETFRFRNNTYFGNDVFKLGSVDMKYKDILTSNQACSIVSSSVNDCLLSELFIITSKSINLALRV